jgi:hypothetical protein
LPKNYRLISVDPEPDEISENVLHWHEATFIPQVVYKKVAQH